MKNLKISFLIPHLKVGGAERVAVNLMKEFTKCGINTNVILFWREGMFLSYLPHQIEVIDLNVPKSFYPYKLKNLISFLLKKQSFYHDIDFLLKVNTVYAKILFYLKGIPAMYPMWLNTITFKLTDHLRTIKPDILLSFLNIPNLVATKSKYIFNLNHHLVLSEHSTLSIKLQEIGKWSKFIEKSVKYYYPKADTIIAVSQGVANDLISHFRVPKEKIQVIYNPVISPELFQRIKDPIEHIWFNKKKIPIILSVGRLTKAKDYPTLLRAFSIVRQQNPVRLVILGDGEERINLERLAEKLGIQNDVSMPGFVENPFAFMANADVFVLSSAREGLPTVIIEALACGCPVVATDCRSGPREILDNGRYGRLVPVGDHEALAKAILETLDNPDYPADRETRIKRAMEFSIDVALDKYLKVLTKNVLI